MPEEQQTVGGEPPKVSSIGGGDSEGRVEIANGREPSLCLPRLQGKLTDTASIQKEQSIGTGRLDRQTNLSFTGMLTS